MSSLLSGSLLQLLTHISNQSPKSTDIPNELLRDINECFSSLESLKADFIATASAMFGPGFVWIVKTDDQAGNLRILNTYLAGSPYPGAHWRRQPADMGTQTTNILGGQNLPSAELARRTNVQNYVGSFGSSSKNQKVAAPGGILVKPVLCVNTWEHVWLGDWGVGGKDNFLEAWWNKINWDVVFQNCRAIGGKSGYNYNPLAKY